MHARGEFATQICASIVNNRGLVQNPVYIYGEVAMKTIEEQLNIIQSFVGDGHKIEIQEDGFLSRGFVVDNGKLVFKFPRNPHVQYQTEIANLNYINSLNLGVNLQRVTYVSSTNEYLGIYGVLGHSLEKVSLDEQQQREIGRQLGVFLKKLHQIEGCKGLPCNLSAEIAEWQNRVTSIHHFIVQTFTQKEQQIINKLMFEYMPDKLNALGEKLVFSHGDLGDGNVFVDENHKVGIIDFNESGLIDEAGDFMDISSDTVRDEMLNAYGADKELREKVEIRKDIRSLIALKPYLTRNNLQIINALVEDVRKALIKYEYLLNGEIKEN